MGSTPIGHPLIGKEKEQVKSMVANALQRPTLVLNRNWQPVNVATVARALVLLWNESARVVDAADYQTFDWNDWSELRPDNGDAFVQAIRFRIRVPEVITLTEYDRLPTASVTFSRRNIFKRDKFVCQYCGEQPGTDALTIDHVVPRAQGGESRWDNCVLACVDCNHRKADRTPQQAAMRLRRTPVRPKWTPLYAAHDMRIESWSKFVSEAYWNVELEK
jgi:5-methylcytosine-specific restriction endonuclease McrA